MKFILNALLFLFLGTAAFSQPVYDEASAPKVDGKINDAEWRSAKVINDFYVTIPKSTEKDHDSTIIYLRQTSDALYIAFKFWPKGKVISKSLVRDRSTDEENEFFILLDMENKGQNGYFFAFSFLNNQRDAIIFNERNMSNEWDWVWECESTIHSEAKNGKPGYIESEIKIPVEKMQNKNKNQIGIAFQLFAYKPDGTSYWYSDDPNMELLSLKSTSKIDIKPFNEKLALDVSISPFVVGTKFNDRKYRGALGGELNLSYEKHKLKGTVFTDQSTLEADPFRFSFYNRPIFLQEKRPFFSKDLDIYRSNINVFYTRAIDSIDYGANYTFRSDKLKAGVIYVNEPRYDNANKKESSKSYFAARPTFVFPGFNAGALFLYTKNKVTNVEEKVISFDGKINLPSRFRLLPQYIRSYRNGVAGNAYSAYLYYEFDNTGGPYTDISYTRYDENFNVSTAFTDFGNNYDNFSASGGYNFRRNTKTFSDINVNAGYNRARDLETNYKYSEGVFASLFYKVNGWLSLNHSFEYNRPNAFDENGNLTEVKFTNKLMDNNLKILLGPNAFYLGYYTGRYFGEYLHNPYATFDLSITNRLSLNIALNYRKQSEIDQFIYRAKLDYKVMDRLYLRSFFQKDTYNNLALWNTLVQYEFFAGSSAYFVLNLEGPKLQNTRRFFKIGYEFSF